MSHFTVLVIGENHESQLAPYHEFECTGENDQYVQDVDVTQEMQEKIDKGESIEDALGWYGLDDKIVDDESKVDKVGDKCAHKYGYAIVQDGKLVKAVNRTNPNQKWDWYQVGGRWSGFLKLKAGAHGLYGQRSWANPGEDEAGYCDQAKKSDIDFEGMRNEAGERAAKNWDLFDKHLAQFKDGFLSWDEVRKSHEDMDTARNEYHAQPLRKAMSELASRDSKLSEEDRSFFVWLEVEDYLQPRESFIQQQRDKAIATFAVIKDGQWYERGEMGWWACVSNEKEQSDWNRQFNELLDGLPDDTLLTVIDCHI